MRIVVTEFVSLDGVMEEPRWTFDFDRGPEGDQFKYEELFDADSLLLGRVTYEEFAAHWPHQAGEMADTMNGTAKYVVSGTLTSAGWQNSTLIPAATAAAEIAELKQRPGKNIGMTGSATLVAWLLREGLLDELHLLVFPVVLGRGKRLFGHEGSHARDARAGPGA